MNRLLTKFEAMAEVYVWYSTKKRLLRASITTHHYNINEHIPTQYEFKDTTAKDAVFEFSKTILQEYYLMTNTYKYKIVGIKIYYTNNRIFNNFMDKNNEWMDQLKNLLDINYSLIFKKEVKK